MGLGSGLVPNPNQSKSTYVGKTKVWVQTKTQTPTKFPPKKNTKAFWRRGFPYFSYYIDIIFLDHCAFLFFWFVNLDYLSLFYQEINLKELNKEVELLRKQTTMMREKIFEQNCVIKNMCKSFSKKLQVDKEQQQQQQQQLNTSSNTTTTTTTTTSSVRLSSCSNEVSSGSFNLNSSQVFINQAACTASWFSWSFFLQV